MTTIELLQNSIDYIEDNLKSEITISEIAEVAGFSDYHFYRLFSSYVGIPVSAYITKRRLQHGIYNIQLGEKAIDVALQYGFDTYPGFYKAFKREFGCSPTKYLEFNTVRKPIPMDLIKEAEFMLNKRQVTQLLSNWNIDKNLEIKNNFSTGNSVVHNGTWTVGEEYIFKTGKNISGLKTYIEISRKLEKSDMFSSTPVKTLKNDDFIIEGDRYYILTNRVKGEPLTPEARYTDDRETIGGKYGKAIANLHRVLKEHDNNIDVNDTNLVRTVLDWALPKTRATMEQWGCPLPDEFYEDYTNTFPKIYEELPKHIIHRDPNPSNIMFWKGEVSGFIDFEISERNLRIFDPCYCATGILSEATEVEGSYDKWNDILRGIIKGYDKVAKLSEAEKNAIPYVIYSIQMIFIAWLPKEKSYRDLAIRNREMLVWIWENRDSIMKLW